MHKKMFSPLLILLLAACSPFASEQTGTPSTEAASEIVQNPVPVSSPTPEETLTLPISIYILDDADGEMSSARTETELRAIYTRVNEIWSQAGITFEIRTVVRVAAPRSVLDSVIRMDFTAFYDAANNLLDIPTPSLINGFYAKDIGGPNGITPVGARLFFVMDTPSVYDERVSSHEIGHILGLSHTFNDAGRLMYSGTNGMTLTDEEAAVARYNARILLGVER